MWVSESGGLIVQLFEFCWLLKTPQLSIVLDNMNFGMWFHVAPPRPPAHMHPWFHILSWHTDHACSMHIWIMFSWSSISLILVSFQTNVSLTTAQLSAVSLRAHCRTKGKNDSKDKMVCRFVHDDCNMCGVDVYYLPPSFPSLCFIFPPSISLFPLSLSPPSSYFSSLPFWQQSVSFPDPLTFEKGGLVFWVIFLATWSRVTFQFENV